MPNVLSPAASSVKQVQAQDNGTTTNASKSRESIFSRPATSISAPKHDAVIQDNSESEKLLALLDQERLLVSRLQQESKDQKVIIDAAYEQITTVRDRFNEDYSILENERDQLKRLLALSESETVDASSSSIYDPAKEHRVKCLEEIYLSYSDQDSNDVTEMDREKFNKFAKDCKVSTENLIL
jgi:hypothetical protein